MINPNWKPGDRINSVVDEMISLDAAELDLRELYRLMIGTILPRPIAFVSTINQEGVVNLAPFSFFNGVGSNPPALMISIAQKPDGSKKDTLKNIEENSQFVVNTVSESLVEAANYCSAEYPHGVSELEQVGLTPIKSLKIAPPRVKQSAVQMECELYKSVEVGDGSPGSATVIIGKILMLHFCKNAYGDGKPKVEKLKPVARLGGISYAYDCKVVDIPRPKIAKS